MNTPKRLIRTPLTWFLVGTLAFLYLEEFILPGTPILALGDQSTYLLNAMRMLNGQMIYRDFFQFTLPGTEVTYLALFKLFGPRAAIPNATLLLLGFSLTWVTVAISKKVMDGWSVFLPGLLFLAALVFPYALDATHHWFSTLAVMIAVEVVLVQRSPARLAATGALCGLALFFTQSAGVTGLLGFAVFLLWERRQKGHGWASLLRQEGYLFGSFAATAVGCNAYFVWKVGVGRLLYCAVVFGVKYFPSAWFNTWRVYMLGLPRPHFGFSLSQLGVFLLIHGCLPLVFLLFFVRERREAAAHPLQPWDRLMLLNIVGLFLFAGVAAAPSYLRLCSVSPPALIMLVWFMNQPGAIERIGLRLLWAAALLWMLVDPVYTQTHWRAYLDLPYGRTAFFDRAFYERYKWVSNHTRPSEFFLDASWSDLYFPLDLRDPAEVPSLTSTNYTRPEQVQEAVRSLERDRVRYVFWDKWLNIPDDPNPAADHLAPLRDYLRAHYHVVKTFGTNYQVWERNALP